MHHRWENLLFLHWRVAPERIQQTLPKGLTVDTYQGSAYLGITAFFMAKVRLVGTPALPWFSFFQELNVRTYAFDRDGVPGVWFYSLDCNRRWAVLGARVVVGLPYFAAAMKAQRDEWINYSCRRRGSGQTANYRYRPSGKAQDCAVDSLEFFLLERYYLFARRSSGALSRAQVGHTPYRHRPVDVAEYSTIPAQLDGFTDLSGEPVHKCFVDGFEVNVFAQEMIEGVSSGQTLG